ncbi:MAG TPA: metallophosphoesterase [Microvirga sp.]|jgi:3',5'-cyclic AMP phosphodiesterase CpdA|nr:metallophosphoesterase [Microvirga sp.]
MIRIAIVADPHFHDVYGDYDFTGPVNSRSGRPAAVRTLEDTVKSTRIFNESYFALPVALDDIATRGIRHVVIAGDYSDDGQLTTVAGVLRLLRAYRDRHGLAFHLTVGNHDVNKPFGHHQSKDFLNPDGSRTQVTSDPAAVESGSAVVTEKMHGLGYDETVATLAEFGFRRRAEDLHWETPFGTDPTERAFEVVSDDGSITARVPDASYLVEPVEGLWLLAIDANVYVPQPGEPGRFTDPTDGGWDALVRHKPRLLDWIRDVTRRAEAQGKHLVAFSHYPVADYTHGMAADLDALLGPSPFTRRNPDPATSEAVLAAGLTLHFSGHLHVNATGTHRSGDRELVNVAVPSLAAYPAAYKIVTIGPDGVAIETVAVDDVPRFDELFEHYRQELRREGGDFGAFLDAGGYRGFLREHLTQLVRHRHLPNEWPDFIRALSRDLTLADLVVLAFAEDVEPADAPARLRALRCGPDAAVAAAESHMKAAGVSLSEAGALPFEAAIVDWFRVRNAGALAFRDLAPERIALYRAFIDGYPPGMRRSGLQASLAIVARLLAKALAVR